MRYLIQTHEMLFDALSLRPDKSECLAQIIAVGMEGVSRYPGREGGGMISRSLEPAPAAPGETRPPMPLEELDRWLRNPRKCQPVAESLSMLDGFVAAIVAGPATYEPLAWPCPLLGVTKDAINDATTDEYAAIDATAAHHNALSATLSETPERFAPLFVRDAKGAVDIGPWCRGFYAAIQLNPKAGRPQRCRDFWCAPGRCRDSR